MTLPKVNGHGKEWDVLAAAERHRDPEEGYAVREITPDAQQRYDSAVIAIDNLRFTFQGTFN